VLDRDFDFPQLGSPGQFFGNIQILANRVANVGGSPGQETLNPSSVGVKATVYFIPFSL
jgi:hypothetical protein